MPDWRPHIRQRLSKVRLSPVREAEIEEELAQHLEDRWRELEAGGASEEEATRIALQELGEGQVLADRLARLRQARWSDPVPRAAARGLCLEDLGADLRRAGRALRATPAFTIATLVVLALGIGATTAIFTVVDAVVLRGLPFDDADRIVAVGERRNPGPIGKPSAPRPAGILGFGGADPEALLRVQPQNYLDWVAEQRVFESIAAIADGEFTLITPASEPEAVAAQRVTSSFFDVLRIAPAQGRAFAAAHEAPGPDHVVILSDTFWQRRFGGNPGVIGRALSLDGEAYEVIGVMPPGFSYPVGALHSTDLWVPYVVPANERVRGRGHSIYLQSIARLRQGVAVEQARAQMGQIAAALEKANPEWNRGVGVGVRPLKDHVVGASTRSWLLMLLAAVAIVLVIACANVANLMLARATTRQREVAVRSALGAGRWRLARQFMVESLVLSSGGTALAVVLAWWGVGVLRGAMPEGVPRVATIAVDWRVLAAAAGLAVVTGLLCGIVPALQSSKADLTKALQEGGRPGSDGRRRQRLRHTLLVAELGLAVVLVVGAALFTSSFLRVMKIDLGFRPEGVLSVQVYQRVFPGRLPDDIVPALEEIVARLAQGHGIVAASAATPGVPLRDNQWRDGFRVPGQPLEGVGIKSVTPSYHDVLGISLRSGRLFTTEDRADGPRVALINESAARRFFPDEPAVGRTAMVAGAEREVVGVVADARQGNLEAAAAPEVYLPLTQCPRPVPSGYLAVRTAGEPRRLLPVVRSTVLAVLPNMPLRYVASMDQLVAGQTAQRRLTMLMLGLLGVLGLVIAAVGVYGVVAYLVVQRTREIGVRMALGASRARVLGMVVRQASQLVALGVVLGGTGAFYLANAIRSFLFGLDAVDLRACAAAAAVLSGIALLACVLPARRAASIDPTVALRNE